MSINLRSARGQALLEVTIAAGLAVIIISAIAITSIIGLRNSQFAQNQIQATKYAQEGLELVRAIQSRNCPVISSSGSSYYWYDNPDIIGESTVWLNQSNFADSIFKPDFSGTNCQLAWVNVAETLNTRFRREIQISSLDPASNTKIRITSVVSWTDYSGDHQSQLVTILSDG